MRPQELANRCAESVNFHTLNGMPAEDACVMVTTPKGWKAPPRFPRRRIASYQDEGTRVRWFPALKLLAWLVGHGMAEVDLRTIDGHADPT